MSSVARPAYKQQTTADNHSDNKKPNQQPHPNSLLVSATHCVRRVESVKARLPFRSARKHQILVEGIERLGRGLDGGELEVDLLAGKAAVDRRERVELVLERGGVLGVKEAGKIATPRGQPHCYAGGGQNQE